MSHSKNLSTANNEFTVSLYQALYPFVASENLVFSPFSLHTVLGMVCEGARGGTRIELVKALKFAQTDSEVISNGYDLVLAGLQKGANPETYTLLAANRVYSQTGFKLNPQFVQSLRRHFKTDIEQLDFSDRGKCKAAAKRINEWVEANTLNKIKNIVSPDAFGSWIRLVLVSGVYFKGLWKHEFAADLTSKQFFRISPTEQVDVYMMRNTQLFPYGKLPKLKAEAVALPYSSDRLSMVIILPKDVDGLARIQSNIGSVLVGGKSLVWDSLTTKHKVELSLPKFSVETSIHNLAEVFDKLGMKSMFYGLRADFSGIPDAGEQDDLFISKVIQKAFIEVGEEGAEGAAGSVAQKVRKSSSPLLPTIPFVVNHPFYYQIVDHANGEMVLFSGHVIDPSTSIFA